MNVQYLNSGDFSDVYSIGEGKVLKAFKIRDFDYISEIEDIKSVVKAYWQAEVQAYKIVNSIDSLKCHFPKFYGVADPHELLRGVEGFADRYVKGCGFIIDLLEGECFKVSLLDSPMSDDVDGVLEQVSEQLSNVNVYDASAFILTDGSFKIFDFGQWADSNYEAELFNNKCLTNEMKQNYLPE
ncbi:hypothetical protein M2G63_22265 [Vibrio vulnificus]|nr:hypothetical protein [Vibrio vulnificus]MCU8540762.1 hypothetical protein [Vibrio vulnificus]MCU8545183.1 hypothetical protein [Vibrio vulnificus]